MGRTATVVIAAVLGVVVGAGVTYVLVHKDEPAAPAMVQVVVANEDMVTGHRITADDLHTILVPDDQVVVNAATALSQVVGCPTTVPVYQNEQIPIERLGCGVA